MSDFTSNVATIDAAIKTITNQAAGTEQGDNPAFDKLLEAVEAYQGTKVKFRDVEMPMQPGLLFSQEIKGPENIQDAFLKKQFEGQLVGAIRPLHIALNEYNKAGGGMEDAQLATFETMAALAGIETEKPQPESVVAGRRSINFDNVDLSQSEPVTQSASQEQAIQRS